MADAHTNAVQKLYISYFGRPADTGGLAYWTAALAANPDALQEMSLQFSLSQEYAAAYAGMDNRARVVEAYDNLFSRAAEAAGVDYWAKLLDTNQMTADSMVTAIAAGSLGNDRIAFNGKVAAAEVFTARLDLPNEQAAYSGTTANAIAANWIATINDLMTGAAAQDVGVVDGVIAQIVGAPPAGMADSGWIV